MFSDLIRAYAKFIDTNRWKYDESRGLHRDCKNPQKSDVELRQKYGVEGSSCSAVEEEVYSNSGRRILRRQSKRKDSCDSSNTEAIPKKKRKKRNNKPRVSKEKKAEIPADSDDDDQIIDVEIDDDFVDDEVPSGRSYLLVQYYLLTTSRIKTSNRTI